MFSLLFSVDDCKGNAMVKNLYDERCKANSLCAKDESIQYLESQVAEAKKEKAYVETIQDATVMVKDIMEKSFTLAEAEKKKVKDSLAQMHTM